MSDILTNQGFDQGEGENRPISITKLKEYGFKAYGPLIDVVYKYQDEFTPYLAALVKGLQGARERLNSENASEAEKYVSHFFQEASQGLEGISQKLSSKDINVIKDYLEEQGRLRPSIMFSSSYIAGLLLGRLGRHIIGRKSAKGDEVIH